MGVAGLLSAVLRCVGVIIIIINLMGGVIFDAVSDKEVLLSLCLCALCVRLCISCLPFFTRRRTRPYAPVFSPLCPSFLDAPPYDSFLSIPVLY